MIGAVYMVKFSILPAHRASLGDQKEKILLRSRKGLPGHECGHVVASFQDDFRHAILTGYHNSRIASTELAGPQPENALVHEQPKAVGVQCKSP